MPSQAKTRFFVTFDDRPHQLFSIRETPDGDLILPLAHAENYEQESGENDPIREDRISVHPSPNSNGTTVKRTIRLESGQLRTMVLFVKNTDQALLNFVMAYACPTPPERSLLAPRANDSLVATGEYKAEDKATMVYSIWITKPGASFPQVFGFSLVEQDFRLFRIGVYYGFADVPPSGFGAYQGIGSSSERINGVPVADFKSDGAKPMTDTEVPEFLKEAHLRVVAHNTDRVAKLLPEPQAQLLREYPLWLSHDIPYLMQGRLQRALRRL